MFDFLHARPGYLSHRIRREIKEMYWSTSIADFAVAAVMLFEPIFLVAVLHFSLAQVMYFFIAVYVIYFFLMVWGANVATTKGYEHAIFYSNFFQVIYWALLFGSRIYPWLIFLAPLAYALEKSLFWPAFYADMARFSSTDQRGRENSSLYGLIAIVYIVGPFFGGIILEKFGFSVLFVIASILMFASVIPLFTTPEKFVPKKFPIDYLWKLYKTYPKTALAYWGYGEELIQLVIWPIFIYLTVPDFFKFGTIIGVSTLISTLVMLYVGVLTDKSPKRILIRYLAFFNGVFWAIRSFFASAWGVLATSTLGTITKDSLIIPITSLTYDRANETHIMPYVVFAEQNLVIGKILMALLVLVLLVFTANYFYIFLAAGLFSLLYSLL